jgi:hypothetical protein
MVSEVLAEKVESGYFSQEVASDLTRMIFRENAWQLYRLDEKRNKIDMPFGSGFSAGRQLLSQQKLNRLAHRAKGEIDAQKGRIDWD